MISFTGHVQFKTVDRLKYVKYHLSFIYKEKIRKILVLLSIVNYFVFYFDLVIFHISLKLCWSSSKWAEGLLCI